MTQLSLTINDILNDSEYGLGLSLLAGKAGLSHRLYSSRLQKPGLALTGYTEHLHPDRLQLFGNTEISYLNQLSKEQLAVSISRFCSFPISCLVITKDLTPPDLLMIEAEKANIPVLGTELQSSLFISLITKFLEERLLPTTHIHGVLVDVLGVGVLLIGKSGIGKSECALDLVIRGHRLVGDDIISVKRKVPAALVGESNGAIQHHMEIRGLGIINIKDLFGVSSIREKKIIDLVIELVEWDLDDEYDRLGIEDRNYEILGVKVQYLEIPVRPGRNITSIIEIAARNFLLKGMGYNSAKDFHERLLARIKGQTIGGEVE